MTGRTTGPFVIGVLVIASACGIPGASGWETTALTRQAAADLNCDEKALTTYDAGNKQYSVRGCGKRARYVRAKCNRVDRSCVYTRKGDVVADQSPAGQSGNPADVTITPR